MSVTSTCLREPPATSRPGPDEVMDALLGRQQGENLGMDPQADVRTSGHLQDSCGIWFYSHKGADRGPPAGFLPSFRCLPLFWCPGALLQALHTAGRDSGHRLLDRDCLVIDCPCSELLALASSATALFFSKAVTRLGTPDQTICSSC